MNIQIGKILLAGALASAALAVNAQAADQGFAMPTAYEDRVTDDQRINDAVLAAIANDSSLDGTIEAQTRDGRVTLTGLVTTVGQAHRARMDAESVDGVREVDNQVNADVGKNF